MSLSDFKSDPWKTSHLVYDTRTFFSIKPAPEFATAEVVLASLYRSIGFSGVSEKDVPSNGREFSKDAFKPSFHASSGSKLDLETWRTLVHGALESPKQPNQSSKRFLQLSPVIPDIAIYSGSARLAGSSWNPGQMLQHMVGLGSENIEAAERVWQRLYDALSVSESDDIWARWLKQEFDLRHGKRPAWNFRELKQDYRGIPHEEKQRLCFPAKQFVRDLESVLSTKESMTRKQWISLLESLLRLGSVSHVIWLCDVHRRIWSEVHNILWLSAPPPEEEFILKELINCRGNFLTYGNAAVKNLEEYASRYLTARIGINATLWHLTEIGMEASSLDSCDDLFRFFRTIHEHKEALVASGIKETYVDLLDEQSRAISCKKGIGSNLKEFARHVLGQRKTTTETLRGYDQGYVLKKQSDYDRAPWIVSLGPVAVLAIVHCCLKDAAGPRSITRLSEHLCHYGIKVDRDDITASELGKELRMLGLVLDSPDAENGMLLVPPFESNKEIE